MVSIAGKSRTLIGLVTISMSWVVFAHAGDGVVASKSLTIQAAGPRQGVAGGRYFNVQGKNQEKYAGFGVLVFPVPKAEATAEIKGLTITLVQSVPSFSSDGKIQFFLAQPADADPGSLEKLKYDPAATRGVTRDAFKLLSPLGSGVFKKVETGKIDTFALTADQSVRNQLRDLIKSGGPLYIVVAPDDDDVAATYFGAGNETQENRPRIKLAGEVPK